MEQEPKQPASLPDNAYRELAPGEKYSPVMPASSKPKEVTVYSVVFGIVMAIVFSAAAAYLGLRVGQVFEAAIPIAIIAVGVGNLTGRSGMLGKTSLSSPSAPLRALSSPGRFSRCRRFIFWDWRRSSTRFSSRRCSAACSVSCC